MKITIPYTIAEKMALFPDFDFNKLAAEAIEKYVNENEPRLPFELKEARRIMQVWRERI
jgi:hypothetical protein